MKIKEIGCWTATVTLHRVSDRALRTGSNPSGGEHGYGVGEVGTVHAQGEAARAFGLFAYVKSTLQKQDSIARANGDPHLR